MVRDRRPIMEVALVWEGEGRMPIRLGLLLLLLLLLAMAMASFIWRSDGGIGCDRGCELPELDLEASICANGDDNVIFPAPPVWPLLDPPPIMVPTVDDDASLGMRLSMAPPRV